MSQRRSIFGPLLLIGLGVVFLLSTLNLLPGGFWNTLSQLWPILLIAGGLDSLYKRSSFASPIVFIGFGVLILMSNLGYISIRLWDLLVRLWPMILIAIGADIAIGRRKGWYPWIGVFVGLVLTAIIAWVGIQAPIGYQAQRSEAITRSLDQVATARVEISAPLTNLEVTGGAGAAYLVEGKLDINSNQAVQQDYEVINSVGSFRLTTTNYSFSTNSSFSPQSDWKLKVNPEIPLDMQSNMVLGDQKLDFSSVNLKTFKVNTVMGKTVITLPSANLSGTFDGVFGDLVLMVPKNTAVQITTSSILVGSSVPIEFKRTDHSISISPAGSESSIVIRINQIFGSLVIQYAP